MRRELNIAFAESERNRCPVDDFGNILPENFDDEEIYKKRIRQLRLLERTIDEFDD